MKAARKGELENVKSLVKREGNVNHKNDQERTEYEEDGIERNKTFF